MIFAERFAHFGAVLCKGSRAKSFQCKEAEILLVPGTVADLDHFDTDPDPNPKTLRIRFGSGKMIRIRIRITGARKRHICSHTQKPAVRYDFLRRLNSVTY
jgi:hypothetical protein